MEQKVKMGWKKYLLIGSLGLNLLVAFAVGGAVLKSGKSEGQRSGVFLQGAMMHALPKEDQSMLRDQFRMHREKMKSGHMTNVELRTELRGAITAVPFDEAALSTVLSKQRDLRDGFAQAGDDAMVTVIAQMSDAERARFAKNLKFRNFKPKKK